ncbi:MAG: hypothetical protein Q8O67_29805 [Deltaproteobacteria bacterium]|nr:hypothetical protein [Deltaproteobacteria bacterium]
MTTTNGLPPVSIPTIVNQPVVTQPAVTTTATTTATPPPTTTTGLNAATTNGPLPNGTVIPPHLGNGLSTLASRLSPSILSSGKTPLLELRPGVVADAVSITAVLKQLGNGPQGQAVVDGLAAQMKQHLGIAIPPALIAAAKANPERVVDLLALTTGQMHAGFDAMHAHHQVQTTTTAATTTSTARVRQLPRNVKTQNLDTIAIARPQGELKQLQPGLWQGDVKNDKLDDKAAKKNIVLAEIFDRLASNPTAAKGELFSVEHNGHRFTNLQNFVAELVKDGHTVEAVISHRVADFCSLKTKAPDGSILDVPAAVLVKTGFKDAAGNEAVVPGVHSEVVFKVRSGPLTKGEKLDGDLKWYQGVPNTGFFPCELMRKSTWTGTVDVAQLDQTKALQALSLAAVLGDVIQDVGQKKNLAMSGYGVTGVCNDSVAIIQQAMTGSVTGYPLFMRDDVLLPEIALRMKDKNHRDDAALATLKSAILAVPNDDVANVTQKTRALASIPWTPGNEPFTSVADARTILST